MKNIKIKNSVLNVKKRSNKEKNNKIENLEDYNFVENPEYEKDLLELKKIYDNMIINPNEDIFSEDIENIAKNILKNNSQEQKEQKEQKEPIIKKEKKLKKDNNEKIKAKIIKISLIKILFILK